jgi:hypothetical protein
LVVLEAVGSVPLDEYIAVLDEALSRPDCPRPAGLLADSSRSSAVRSTAEMRRLADHLSQVVGRVPFVAVVAPRDVQFGLTRMVSVFLDRGGPETEAFRSVAEAQAWLVSRMTGPGS